MDNNGHLREGIARLPLLAIIHNGVGIGHPFNLLSETLVYSYAQTVLAIGHSLSKNGVLAIA